MNKKDLERNRYIGFWDDIHTNLTDTLMSFYSDNETNNRRYNELMCWILTDDPEYKKKMIAFYYNIDNEFYQYAMNRLERIYAKEDKPKIAIGDSKDLEYIILKAGNSLRMKHMLEESNELEDKAEKAKTFEEAIKIINQYVEFVDEEEQEDEDSYFGYL